MSVNTPQLPLPIRVFGVVAFLLAMPFGAQAQQPIAFPTCDTALLCRDFQKIRAKTLDYLAKEDGAEAYKQLKALEACDKCPEHRDAIDAISDEIIGLFRKQNEVLDGVIKEQQATLLRLQKLNEDLAQEQRKVDRQLTINEQITRDALATNFVRLAQKYLDDGTEIGRKEAAWIADFTYTYVDSTHHDLKKVMYKLLNEHLRASAPFDLQGEAEGYESTEEVAASEEVSALEWSPDGQFIAVGTSSGQLILMDDAENVLFKAQASSTPIERIAWHKDGNLLAFLITDSEIGFLRNGMDAGWEWAGFSIERMVTMMGFRFSPVSDLLAIGDDLNTLSLYAIGANEVTLVQTFPTEHNDWIRDVAWSPDGTQLVTGADDGMVITWSVANNAAVQRKKVHTDYVRTVDWHPSAPMIVSGSDDNRVIFWDAEQLTPIVERGFGAWILKARFTEFGDGVDVFFLDESSQRITIPQMNGETDKAAAPSVRQDHQAYTSPQGNIKLGAILPDQLSGETTEDDLSETTLDEVAIPESGTISLVGWSPDGERLAFAKDYSLLVADGTRILHVNLEEVGITGLDWHPGLSEQVPNTNYLVTIDGASRLVRWDVADMDVDKLVELDRPARAIQWSPDGSTLAIGNDAGELLLFDRDLNPLYRQTIHTDYIRQLAWSPNGRYIATASDDRSNVVWDIVNNSVKATLNMHQDWGRTVTWLDDTHFVSAGDDRQALLWEWSAEANTYRVAQTLKADDGFYYALAFNPSSEGGTLALGTSNGQIMLWNIDAQAKATKLDSVITANTISDLDWHPTRGELSYTQFGTVPMSLNIALQEQPAVEQQRAPLEKKTFAEAYLGVAASGATAFYTPNILLEYPTQAQWSSDERYLAAITLPKSGDYINQLEVHDMAANALKMVYRMETVLADLAFAPNDRYLAVVTKNGQLTILNVATETALTTVEVGNLYPIAMAWSGNSRYVAVLDTDFNLHILDLQKNTVQTIAVGVEMGNPVSIAFHPTNDTQVYYFTSAAIWQQSRVRPVAARRVYTPGAELEDEAPRYPGDSAGFWLEGGAQLLYKSEGYPLQLLQVRVDTLVLVRAIGDATATQAWNTGDTPLMYEYPPISSIDGRYNGSDLQYARGWNIANGDALTTLRGVRKQVVDDLALTPDGRQLASLGYRLLPLEDGKYQTEAQTVSIWELDIQKEVFELEVPGATAVRFSPLANYLTVFFSSGRVAVWPLEVSRIYRWLNASDKDRYLQQLATKGNEPLQNRIEEWELERGLSLKPAENIRYLIRRENAKVRQNWGLHFVSQAWLAVDLPTARSRFAQALALHDVPNWPGNIRATQQDTLAVVNILFEQAYFAQVHGEPSEALARIGNAKRLAPPLNRIRMWEVLQAWQQGRQQPALELLISSERTQLLEEVRQWKKRDIPLQQERFFNRLLAVSQSQIDPATHPMVSPLFEEDIRRVPADLGTVYLAEYYRLNREHPGLVDNPDLRKQFVETALRFFDDNYKRFEHDENRLRLYVQYNYDLQGALSEQGKQQELMALRLGAERLLEKLQAISPDNKEYRDYTLYAKADRLLAQLKLQPGSVAEVEDQIRALAQEYANSDTGYLRLLQGHCQWLRGQERPALDTYVSLLVSGQYDVANVMKLIDTQLGELAPTSAPRINEFLQRWSDYDAAKTDFSYYLQTESIVDSTAQTNYWAGYWERAATRFRTGAVLNGMDALPSDTLAAHRQQWAAAGNGYVWSLLEAGRWEDADEIARAVAAELPNLQWPQVTDVVQLLFRQGWSVAKPKLRAIRELPNDGQLSDRYPRIGDLLLQLPPAITQNPIFLKYQKKWAAAVGRRS